MANCSVCGKPATSQITITENGQRRQLTLCDEHYMEFMARNQRSLSPLESLFHGGLFDRLFDDSWLPLEDAGDRPRIIQRLIDAGIRIVPIIERAAGMQHLPHVAIRIGATRPSNQVSLEIAGIRCLQ